MVAAAVANGGKLMEPHLTDRIVDRDGRTVDTHPAARDVAGDDAATAGEVDRDDEQVVEEGTGTAAALRASTSPARPAPPRSADRTASTRSWFIAFAPRRRPAGRDRRDGRALERHRRRRRRADRQAVMQELAASDRAARLRDDRRRPLPGRSAASARAGWPTSTAPRTSSSGGSVALKLLHRRFAEDPEFVERFRREASQRRRPAAPERRRRLRPRRVGRHLLHRDGVPRRAAR